MKKLEFIFVGQAKDAAFKTLETHYLDKLIHYADASIVHIKDSIERGIPQKQKKESEQIRGKLKSGDVVVLCDESGRSWDSVAFSRDVEKWHARGKRLVFIVGGAYGVDAELKKSASALLSLSPFTLPHELARTVLLEQVYRALTITSGEKYHHGKIE